MNQYTHGDAMRMNQEDETEWQALTRGDRFLVYAKLGLGLAVVIAWSITCVYVYCITLDIFR